MKVCAVSFKECWQDADGNWLSYGGFPLQMAAIGSLFDQMSLLIVSGQSRSGGQPLPRDTRVVPVRRPAGEDARRKLDVLIHLPYYASKIAQTIRDADVVHIPLPGDIPLLGLLIALLLRKRLIVRYGGSWVETSETTFMNQVTWLLMRLFAGRRNVMLVTGEGASPPAARMHWIFSTALSRTELTQICPALERGLSDPPRLVYAGRLSKEKGLAVLIQAIALLKREQFRPLPLVTLVGGGPEQAVLQKLIHELECETLISFTGQLDRKSLSDQFSQADLCVQPSLTEGFSKAWLDAMAHGLPVLASEVGAADTVVGKCGERGWLVPPGNVEALTATLRRVLTDPVNWAELRQRCRAYVEARTLEAWAQQIGLACARQWNVSLVEDKLRT